MRSTVTALVLGGLALAAPATAQTFGFGAPAGVSLPMSDYADGVNTGFSGGLDLWYPLGESGLSWYTSADAIAHAIDSDAVDSGFFYVPILTGARFDVPVGRMSVFATGQAGVVVVKGPDYSGLAATSVGNAKAKIGTEFGFSFGGGLQITPNIQAGVKYYPLGDVEFKYEDSQTLTGEVSFLDIYVGFGVR